MMLSALCVNMHSTWEDVVWNDYFNGSSYTEITTGISVVTEINSYFIHDTMFQDYTDASVIWMNTTVTDTKLLVYSTSFFRIISSTPTTPIYFATKGSNAMRFVYTDNTTSGSGGRAHLMYLFSSTDKYYSSRLSYSSFTNSYGPNVYTSSVTQNTGIVLNDNINTTKNKMSNEPCFIIYYQVDASKISFYNIESNIATSCRIIYFGANQITMKCSSVVNNTQLTSTNGLVECEIGCKVWLQQIAFVKNNCNGAPLIYATHNSTVNVTDCVLRYNNITALYGTSGDNSYVQEVAIASTNYEIYCAALNIMGVEPKTCFDDANIMYYNRNVQGLFVLLSFTLRIIFLYVLKKFIIKIRL